MPEPRAKMHYLECPECESSFRVPASITLLPAHNFRGALCPGSGQPEGGGHMGNYEAERDKVMYGEDVDLFSARDVAYSWHSGQNSALYSFASTDCTVWSEAHRRDLIREIELAISLVRKSPKKYYKTWDDVDQYTRESVQSGSPQNSWGKPWHAGMDSLENLLRAVKALPAKNDAAAGEDD